MIKLLIGGSPCTYWSIAQTNNRETTASGMGWELFRNYVIARDKYKPDYFIYENNKSISTAIREQITAMLGVEPICINSARVSAQNRQRLYWVGKRNPDGTYSRIDISQPEDRNIMLKDILEHGTADKEKAHCLTHQAGNTRDYFKKHHTQIAFKPVAMRQVGRRINANGHRDDYNEDIECIQRNGVTEPVCITEDGKAHTLKAQYFKNSVANFVTNGGFGAIKSNAKVDATIFNNPHGFNKGGIKYDKTPTLTANGNWQHNNFVIESADGKTCPVYMVKDGQITIKGKQYPIRLADGFYIIRKLTVTECKRLQTVPDSYIFPVSDTQAYKMLGNGWTVDVIVHILGYLPGITTEPLEVFSMYDGMACGHIALDKLGGHITLYFATEIDKYAIKTTMHNFPDVIQLGDAFQVRADDWSLQRGGARHDI